VDSFIALQRDRFDLATDVCILSSKLMTTTRYPWKASPFRFNLFYAWDRAILQEALW